MNEVVKQYIEAGKRYFDEDTLDKFFLSIPSKNYVSKVRRTLEAAGIDVIHNVKNIVSYMYHCDTKLTKITIPSNISTVKEFAFSKCSNLEVVEFEEGCDMICEHSFSCDDKLRKLVLPKSMKYIDRYISSGSVFLRTIRYKGTSEEWESISKDPQWLTGSYIGYIVCSDKRIEIKR